MAETTIRPALPAQELAVDLIAEHHEHLEDARILWLFTTAKRTRGGRVVLGSAARTNALQKFLSSGNESVSTGYDFIVLIEDKRWATGLATQRAALVDHLLCRMVQHEVVNKTTGNTTVSWGTVSPDVEEFTDVILRHGVWLPEQQTFARAIVSMPGRQLSLELPELREDVEKEDEVRSSPDEPERRVTTTNADGLVVKTEVEPPATNGVDHEPGWQEKAGIGASEHEQRRRRRTKAEAGHAVASPT